MALGCSVAITRETPKASLKNHPGLGFRVGLRLLWTGSLGLSVFVVHVKKVLMKLFESSLEVLWRPVQGTRNRKPYRITQVKLSAGTCSLCQGSRVWV